ncbi:hypothetical protein [Xenorhabdus bovienii]
MNEQGSFVKAEVNHSWRFYAYGRMRCKVLHNLLDRQTDRQTKNF